ncbi:hypothetical protein JXR93_05350 [bacterium]|nr:hypothetical protein [bacterium]
MRYFYVLILILVTTFDIFGDNIFQGLWYTTDGNSIIEVNFKNNSSYSFKMGDNTIVGVWKISDGNILEATPSNTLVTQRFGYKFQNNFLILAQSETNYLILSRDKSSIETLMNSVKQQNSGSSTVTSNSTQKLTKKELIYFLENYKNLQSDDIYRYLTRFPESEVSYFTTVYTAAFYNLLYKACESSLSQKLESDIQSCNTVKESFKNTLSLGVNPTEYGDTQIGRYVIYLKCSEGLIDKASCSTYTNTQMQINNSIHKTNMNIINNMSDNNCTKHYDENYQYLGCW